MYSIGRVLIFGGGVSIEKERTTRMDLLINFMHRQFYAIITEELLFKLTFKSNELLLLSVVVGLCPQIFTNEMRMRFSILIKLEFVQ